MTHHEEVDGQQFPSMVSHLRITSKVNIEDNLVQK